MQIISTIEHKFASLGRISSPPRKSIYYGMEPFPIHPEVFSALELQAVYLLAVCFGGYLDYGEALAAYWIAGTQGKENGKVFSWVFLA